MSNLSIILSNVTKKYYLEKPRSFKKWLSNIFSPFEKFTVLKNFSLKVKEGEFILITGPNGCGKTTLLKLIAGITSPDEGVITTYGKVVPIIELHAGFNYELTGRENIITNATILGIKRSMIKKIMPDIIRFSGLRDFIDIPVKRYSSGMISRLAFSIAVFSEPDIFLLDEIFAVGDEQFVKKIIKVMYDLKNQKKTIILSSHSSANYPIVDRKIILE